MLMMMTTKRRRGYTSGDSKETDRLAKIRGDTQDDNDNDNDKDESTCSTMPSSTKRNLRWSPPNPYVLVCILFAQHWKFIRNTRKKPFARYILVVSFKILLVLAFYASIYWLGLILPNLYHPVAKSHVITHNPNLQQVLVEKMNKVILMNEKLVIELAQVKLALEEVQRNFAALEASIHPGNTL